jgi:hypothetical protein
VLWPLAAAATIALVVGVTMMMSATPHSPLNPANPPIRSLPLPFPPCLPRLNPHDQLSRTLLSRRRSSPRESAEERRRRHRTGDARTPFASRADGPAGDPSWYFRGAAICPVGGTPAGHLVFARNDDVISIYSLPKQLAPDAKDGDQFEATIDGHPIAAFAKDGGLFCFISSGPAGSVTLKQLTDIRNQMEDRVTTASLREPARETWLLICSIRSKSP